MIDDLNTPVWICVSRQLLNFGCVLFLLMVVPFKALGDSSLPEWFVKNSVVVQTGLYNQIDRLDEEILARNVSLAGANVIVRHLKQDWRPPIWPSEVPEGKLQDSVDYLSTIQAENSKYGINLVGYYWLSGEGVTDNDTLNQQYNHMGSGRFGTDYEWIAPDAWLCKDDKGKPLQNLLGRRDSIRGIYLDLASGYKEHILIRFKEMVERGVQAFYFDSKHFPPYGQLCRGSSTHDRYKELYGEAIDNHQFAIHQSNMMAEVFDYWRSELKIAYPEKEIVFVISGTYLSGFTLPNMSFGLKGPNTVFKVEYKHGLRRAIYGGVFRFNRVISPPNDVKMSAAWAMLRDISRSPVHMWSEALENDDELRSFLATSLSYGAIAAVHVDAVDLIGRGNPDRLSQVKEAIEFGNVISRHLDGHVPYFPVELVLNEEHKNRVSDYTKSWNKYQSKLFKAYEWFIRAGIPVGFRLAGDGDGVDDAVISLDFAHNDEFHVSTNLSDVSNQYKRADRKLESELLNLTGLLSEESDSIRVDYGQGQRKKPRLHSNFYKSDQSNGEVTVVVAPINEKIGSNKFDGSNSYSNIRIVLKRKPGTAVSLLDNSELGIEYSALEDEYHLVLPAFRYISMVSIKY